MDDIMSSAAIAGPTGSSDDVGLNDPILENRSPHSSVRVVSS